MSQPSRKAIYELGQRQLRRLKSRAQHAHSNDVCSSLPENSCSNSSSTPVSTTSVNYYSLEELEDDGDRLLRENSESGSEDEWTGFAASRGNCEKCAACICISCKGCFHSDVCKHCNKCTEGLVIEHSDIEPESSDDEFSLDKSDVLPDHNENEVQGDEFSQFKSNLILWALQYNISFMALTPLLKVLRLVCPAHTSDARSFLGTPRSTDIKTIPSGSYWHCGLGEQLRRVCRNFDNDTVKYSVGIDGIPISKSSTSTLWPILGLVEGSHNVFIIGVFHGYEKPNNVAAFLEDFLSEAVALCQDGLKMLGGKVIKFYLDKLICDAPAKAFVMQVKSHNAYSSRTNCQTEGDYQQKRMCFPQVNANLRTDDTFKTQTDEDHHIGISPLLKITKFCPVKNVVLDYQHLICLGVMRKLLNFWVKGPLEVRQSSSKVRPLGFSLENISTAFPCEFARKPRSVKYLNMWKATEFRNFLLYTGPVVLYDFLPKHMYQHFLVLHFSILIMCSENLTQDRDILGYAESLLKNFVLNFKDIYGSQYISHNIHNLLHLANDVVNHGCLDKFSTFPFENFMQKLKSFIRKGENPLEQLARRYAERYDREVSTNCQLGSTPDFGGEHRGVVLPPNCSGPQYRAAKFPSFTIKWNDADNCCQLQDGTIVVIETFAFSLGGKSMVAVGRAFRKKEDLYVCPCPSSSIGIYKVYRLSSFLKSWPVAFIKMKMVILSMSCKSYAEFPLLHVQQ